MSARVLISIVTHNSSRHLRPCLESLKAAELTNTRICLWDNASGDDSIDIAADFGDMLDSLRTSNKNIGFCAAHNSVIASHECDFVIVLNPDVILEKRFVHTLVTALGRDPRAGSATGKLWRWQEEWSTGRAAEDLFSCPPRAPLVIDTTGIYFTPAQRHFDRGSGEADTGQYQNREYVFGASGAAACYRREMLEDVKSGDQYFDEDFFAYREDADLAWRAQWMGWKCLYVPEARGFHVRRVLPERRSILPADINMHSFKNRFLLRAKNMDLGTYARFFIPITFRDLGSIAYVITREPSSLRAFPLAIRALPHAWVVRRALKHHRRTTAREMRSWFSYRAVSKPARSSIELNE